MKKGNFITNLLIGIFLFVGVILLASGIAVSISNSNFKKTAEEITAQISDIETYRDSDGELQSRVYVDYTYGGNRYTKIRLNFYSSSMYVGKDITILCDPTNPANIRSESGLLITSMILLIVGAVFALFSTILIVRSAKRAAKTKRVRETGKQLYATVEQIALNQSYTVNGRHPYIIYCTYKDEYRDIIYRFKSENLWTDPGLVLKEGDSIRVYVDEKDYSKYYVDVENMYNGRVVDYT